MKTFTKFFSLLWLFILLFLVSYSLQAQNESTGLSTLDEGESFFISGLSPSVLAQGQGEVNIYNSLFSVRLALRNSLIESPVRDRLRLTEFTTNLETFYGVSRSNRWNIGARIRYGRRRLDNAAQNSPFKVFSSNPSSVEGPNNRGLDENYSGLKEIGLRLRLIPFQNIPNLTVSAGYSVVPNLKEEVQQYLNADRNSLDLSLNYFVSLNENASSYYYFNLGGIAFQPGSLDINDQWLYNSSASFYVVQRLGRFVIYPGLSYNMTFKPPDVSDKTLIKSDEQVLGILGLQYQTDGMLSLNFSAAAPFLLESSNLLQQMERKSYSFVTIGGRVLF